MGFLHQWAKWLVMPALLLSVVKGLPAADAGDGEAEAKEAQPFVTVHQDGEKITADEAHRYNLRREPFQLQFHWKKNDDPARIDLRAEPLDEASKKPMRDDGKHLLKVVGTGSAWSRKSNGLLLSGPIDEEGEVFTLPGILEFMGFEEADRKKTIDAFAKRDMDAWQVVTYGTYPLDADQVKQRFFRITGFDDRPITEAPEMIRLDVLRLDKLETADPAASRMFERAINHILLLKFEPLNEA